MSSCSLRICAAVCGTLIALLGACGKAQRGEPTPAPAPEKTSEKTPASAVPAALSPPPSAAAEREEHGRELYERMCSVCHGMHGEGYKADQAPALGNPGFLASVSDQYLKFAITWGRRGSTMSAWGLRQGGPLSNEDIQAIIAYLRSWPRQTDVKLDDSPPHGDRERGKAIFAKQCASCHGPKGQYVHILNRQLLLYARPEFLRLALHEGRAGTKMQSFTQTIGEQGIEDVVTYLRSLPAWMTPSEAAGVVAPPPLPLGPVPLHPHGPEPKGFRAFPEMTSVDVVGPQLKRGARMAILDARVPSDYAEGHIAGAVSVPYYDPSPYIDQLPKDAWLVCYCGCPHAESGALARQLVDAGFSKVTVLDEGFGVWMQKGLPTRSGTKP